VALDWLGKQFARHGAVARPSNVVPLRRVA